MPGAARNMPITAVNTISDTTRGLVSATKEDIRERIRASSVRAEESRINSVDKMENFSTQMLISAESGHLQQALEVFNHS